MKKIIIIFIILTFLIPLGVQGATFSPNYIISDQDLTDYKSMSQNRIQNFLSGKSGTLGNYITTVSGVIKRASEIIYDAALYYRISPKFLIVLLQKEQSLVTDPTSTDSQYDWATGYGVCDSCRKDDPAIQKYKGFFNQINWAARRNRQYIEEAGRWHYKVGGTYLIDEVEVTMLNQATVNLYTYTPHIHGNQLFWEIWNRWFTKHYPDGSLLQDVENGAIYLIQNGQKRPFWSRIAFFANYTPEKIIPASRNELDAYETSQPIKYPNYSLLQSPQGGVYLLVNGTKRAITSREVFRGIGFNPEEIIPTTWEELNFYPDGEKITMADNYPAGALLQDRETGGVSYVQEGIRHSIMSREILKSRFKNRSLILVDPAEINQYALGDPIKFQEGELVTSPGYTSVFVISNGQKRSFASKEVFDQMGFKWSNIIYTTDRALEIHPTGEPITLD